MIRYFHVRQPLRGDGARGRVHVAAATYGTQQHALPLLILQLYREEHVSQVSLLLILTSLVKKRKK